MEVITPLAIPPLAFHLTESPTLNSSGSALFVLALFVLAIVSDDLNSFILADFLSEKLLPASPPHAAHATLPLLG